MKALQYTEFGTPPQVREVETPEPGPGEVLLQVTAAGICHSDQFVMSTPPDQLPYELPMPLTLGHEGGGIVHAIGAGVDGVTVGEKVVVYGPWGCGRCHACARGWENYCPYALARGILPPGLGAPGAMAEYMLVDDARHLLSVGDLDLVRNVSLTDAGLTPYHAIRTSLPKLGAGTTAVVIGAGGLGHVAIQILKAISGATVVALDVTEDKLALAREVGADHTLTSDASAAATIKEMTGGLGAEVVFDFVGAQPTIDTATAAVAMEGDVVIVGIGGGTATIGFGATPYDASVRFPYWGTRAELIEVFDLAHRGQVTVEVETFALDEAPQAYERLHAGSLRGRAVVLPHG